MSKHQCIRCKQEFDDQEFQWAKIHILVNDENHPSYPDGEDICLCPSCFKIMEGCYRGEE